MEKKTMFEGSIEAFKYFLKGFCKNKVNAITRKVRKNKKGICEHCGCEAELQSAHIAGLDRMKLVEEILNENFYDNKAELYRVDLYEFEKIFVEKHMPIENHFKFLCEKCHKEYDKK